MKAGFSSSICEIGVLKDKKRDSVIRNGAHERNPRVQS